VCRRATRIHFAARAVAARARVAAARSGVAAARSGVAARAAFACATGGLSTLARAGNAGAQSNLWIGGRRDDEHVWSWPDAEIFWTGLVNGAAPPNVYTNWQPGEPNNHSTVSDEPEECAALTLFDSTWKDRACSLALSYFCERAQGG
jgi:hypothetical protein